jgi:hypothetical protein
LPGVCTHCCMRGQSGTEKAGRSQRLTGLHLRALEGIRTPNLLIRSQMLYPLSYERGLSESGGESRPGRPVECTWSRGWVGKPISGRPTTGPGAPRYGAARHAAPTAENLLRRVACPCTVVLRERPSFGAREFDPTDLPVVRRKRGGAPCPTPLSWTRPGPVQPLATGAELRAVASALIARSASAGRFIFPPWSLTSAYALFRS